MVRKGERVPKTNEVLLVAVYSRDDSEIAHAFDYPPSSLCHSCRTRSLERTERLACRSTSFAFLCIRGQHVGVPGALTGGGTPAAVKG